MKLKNYWKRFWTLDRHASAGFTLVELIVVIAILAILAGVGIPVYSGYITKANMQADMTLASEVAHALQLQYYADPTNAATGYVILAPEGVAVPTSGGAAYDIGASAMESAFGANWRESAILKYEEWSDSGIIDFVAKQQMTEVLGASSYLNGNDPSDLLDDVSSLTTSAMKFVTNVNRDKWYEGMVAYFANGDKARFNALCNTHGIEIIGDSEDTYDFGTTVTEQQLANMMVVASANDLTEFKAGGLDEDNYTPTLATGIVIPFAEYKAFANSKYASATDKAAYEQLLVDVSTATTVDDVGAAMDKFEETVSVNYATYGDNEDGTDFIAFTNIMEAVDSLSGEIAGNLNDPDLFAADSKVAGLFDTYISAAEAQQELKDLNLPDGCIVIFLNVIGDHVTVTSTCAGILAQ